MVMSDDGAGSMPEKSRARPEPQRFRSAIDWWYLAVILVPTIRMIWMLIAGLAAGRTPSIGFMFALVAVGAVWYCIATTFYEVNQRYLIAAFGPFKTRVPVTAIHTLRATTSILSAPALSAKRIEVLSGDGPCVMISPTDSARFVDAIRRIVPGVRVEGLPYAPGALQQPERGGGD
jgi:hypothetical protein